MGHKRIAPDPHLPESDQHVDPESAVHQDSAEHKSSVQTRSEMDERWINGFAGSERGIHS